MKRIFLIIAFLLSTNANAGGLVIKTPSSVKSLRSKIEFFQKQNMSYGELITVVNPRAEKQFRIITL